MPKVQIGIQIADDRQTVAIEFMPEGQPPCPLDLSLDQLTGLIRLLGSARHKMVEGQPTPNLGGHEIDTVVGASWYIQTAQIDGSLLAFYHPAFGPVGFAIPKAEVAEIVRLLNNHLALPQAMSADRPSTPQGRQPRKPRRSRS
jgi:hypothetical protein